MKKVLILFGGNSFEHLVSCKSAKSILENIDYKKFNVTACGIDKNNKFYIYSDSLEYLNDGSWINCSSNKKIDNINEFINNFDVVFPIIHGRYGEDGKLQGMLDVLNKKYVGSNLISNAICMDKVVTKIICEYYGIKQVDYMILKENKIDIKQFENKIGYPAIIKPSNGGSSIGITIANNKKELMSSIDNAFLYDNTVVIEKFITARELECAVLEDKKIKTSSIGEIKSINSFYDYEAKYEKDSELIIPADINKSVEKQIKETALKIFKILGCKDYSRVDFLYDEKNNKLYFNEINTIPGFTTISMFPKLFEYDKIKYKDLITKLILNNL